jgi:sugar phosphate isomerase/epimerase
MTNRRSFLRQAAAIVGGSSIALASCQTKSTTTGNQDAGLGVNLFSLPKLLENDFAATMQMLARIGYKKIEFFGPYSFSPAEEKEGWNSITPSLGFSGSGFFGKELKDVRKILDDNGLSCPSMHSALPTLQTNMKALADAANELGATYVTLPSAETQPTLDAYRKQADQFNAIGESARANGVRFAYHNHGNGLKPLEGTVPFELIMDNTDPKNVFFQMDIFWMTAGGVDLVQYLEKYKGRFKLMHVKDMSRQVTFSGDGGDPRQWIELFPFLANAGSGVLDLKRIIAAAKTSGVEHFIVERDLAPDPEADLKASRDFLQALL